MSDRTNAAKEIEGEFAASVEDGAVSGTRLLNLPIHDIACCQSGAPSSLVMSNSSNSSIRKWEEISDPLDFVATRQKELVFPEKLMLLLMYLENQQRPLGDSETDDVVAQLSSSPRVSLGLDELCPPPSSLCASWTSAGDAFVVWNQESFAREMVPLFFGCKGTSFTSFRRKALQWGFRQERFKGASNPLRSQDVAATLAFPSQLQNLDVAPPRPIPLPFLNQRIRRSPQLSSPSPEGSWAVHKGTQPHRHTTPKVFSHEFFHRDNKEHVVRMIIPTRNQRRKKELLKGNLLSIAKQQQRALTLLETSRSNGARSGNAWGEYPVSSPHPLRSLPLIENVRRQVATGTDGSTRVNATQPRSISPSTAEGEEADRSNPVISEAHRNRDASSVVDIRRFDHLL